MNPYQFVPLGTPSPRLPRSGHHVLASFGGVIEGRITTRTPFLIARKTQATVLEPLNDGIIIPGSSLKGMIRSLAEMVGGGCISLSSTLFPRRQYGYKHAERPVGFEPCSDIDRLCTTCRMFGTVLDRECWKGPIEIGEAHRVGENRARLLSDLHVTVGSPKPDHHPFYCRRRALRGRKVYPHHPDHLLKSAPADKVVFGRRQTMQIKALEPGQVYEFRLTHRGLNAEQYSLLLYSLFLEPGLAHKLGWGKPFGLGSVEISPVRLTTIDFTARYRRGGDSASHLFEGETAVKHVAEATAKIRNRQDETITRLRTWYTFPGMAGKEWGYPSYVWFKENSQLTLEEFEQQVPSLRG